MEALITFFRKQKLPVFLLLLFLLIALLIRFCTSTKKPDGKIVLTDPVAAPVAIAFIDANRLLGTQIAKATVTLTDPDGMVVTSNGLRFTTIEVLGGVMSLALKQNAVFSDSLPYRFDLKVEAAGYSTNWYNILVTSNEGQYVPIFMAKLDDPPAGMATFIGTTPLKAGIVSAGAVFDAPTHVNGIPTKNIRIEIPPGTEPIYCNRNNPKAQFPKNLNYRIAYASPRNLAVGRTFPGGSLVTDAINSDGSFAATPKSPIYFASSGWMNLEMDADGDPINGFTKPLSVTMPIADNLVNPLTNRLYKVGDVVPIWSLNDRGIWRQESMAKVEGGVGNLSAKMVVTHLSTWNIDDKVSPCAMNINYTNANTPLPTFFYSELIRTSNGIPYGITGAGTNTTHTVEYAANGVFQILNAPNGENAIYVVYDNMTAPTNALVSTPAFSLCSNQNLTIPNMGARPNVKIAFKVVSTGGAPDGRSLCNNAVWFRTCTSCTANDCATNTGLPFNYGGLLRSSGGANVEGTVTLFNQTPFLNADYCIRLWYGEDRGGTISQQTIDFTVNFSPMPAASFVGKKTVAGVTSDIPMWQSYNNATSTYLFEISANDLTVPNCAN